MTMPDPAAAETAFVAALTDDAVVSAFIEWQVQRRQDHLLKTGAVTAPTGAVTAPAFLQLHDQLNEKIERIITDRVDEWRNAL
jgi:hypothetical protein